MKLDHGPWGHPPARRPSAAARILTSRKLVAAILVGLLVAMIATEVMTALAAHQIGGAQ